MNDYNPSYVVVFKRRDGSLNEEYYYNSKYEAQEHFDLFNDKTDKDNAELYSSMTLKEVDWLNRIDTEIDYVKFYQIEIYYEGDQNDAD